MSETRVTYNNKRLIPAPYVTINKTYTKSGNGDIIGKIYSITINGTVLAWMGSPKSDGSFYAEGGYPDDEAVVAKDRLGVLQRKQEALRDLFSTEGLELSIQTGGGAAPVRCNPRINNISFPGGDQIQWFNKFEYSIELEVDELYPEQEDDFDQYISDASETWSIETNEQPESLAQPRTYRVTHDVSAVGKKFYDANGSQNAEAWQRARDFVLGRLGFDEQMALSSGVHNLPSYYNGWNHTRSSNPDIQNGSFSVSESWVLASGSAIEDWSIELTDELSSPYKSVSINGTVEGFEERDSNMGLVTTKWANAQSKFTYASGIAFTRAQNYTGIDLNIIPLSKTVGRNPLKGTIDYSFDYNNRPMNLIPEALTESISITDSVGGELFASVFVLGKSNGPVLQDLGTQPENIRSLDIELVLPAPEFSDRETSTIQDVLINQKPTNNPDYSTDIQNLIDAVDPSNNGFNTVFQNQPQETWNFREGRFSYNIEWTYIPNG